MHVLQALRVLVLRDFIGCFIITKNDSQREFDTRKMIVRNSVTMLRVKTVSTVHLNKATNSAAVEEVVRGERVRFLFKGYHKGRV